VVSTRRRWHPVQWPINHKGSRTDWGFRQPGNSKQFIKQRRNQRSFCVFGGGESTWQCSRNTRDRGDTWSERQRCGGSLPKRDTQKYGSGFLAWPQLSRGSPIKSRSGRPRAPQRQTNREPLLLGGASFALLALRSGRHTGEPRLVFQSVARGLGVPAPPSQH
jgi:hypothetical protein